jgi:hypothetical protein
MTMGNALMVTLVNPQPGREAEYADWYANTHIPELAAVPAVLSGRLHTAIDFRESPWRHCSVYELDGDPMVALGQIGEFGKAGKIQASTASDPSTRFVGIGTPISARIGKPYNPEDVLFIALTNPVEGQEDEYNRWYNEVHAPEVVAVPGFTGVQRFCMAPMPGAPDLPFGYIALYGIDRNRVEEAFEEMGKAVASNSMTMSPALSQGSLALGYYQLTAARVKAAADTAA